MIHKRLQAHIVRENRLCRLRNTAVATSRMRGRRVELGEEESGLRATSVAYDEAGEGEAVLDQFLCSTSASIVVFVGSGRTYASIFLRRLKQLLEVLIPFHFLVPSLPPLCHHLAVEDKDVKESVKQ